MSYSSSIRPYRNNSGDVHPPVPKGHVRVAGYINATRTMKDKMNQRLRFGKRIISRVWITVSEYDIAIYADKEGRFSFDENYVDIPFYQAKKMAILGEYMSVITKEGRFSKKQQNNMSIPHGNDCMCHFTGNFCEVPF